MNRNWITGIVSGLLLSYLAAPAQAKPSFEVSLSPDHLQVHPQPWQLESLDTILPRFETDILRLGYPDQGEPQIGPKDILINQDSPPPPDQGTPGNRV